MAPSISGKIVNLLSLFSLQIPQRDFNTKKANPNKDVCPESVGACIWKAAYSKQTMMQAAFFFLRLFASLC